jgi:hypothetical protein
MTYKTLIALLTEEHWRLFGGPPEYGDWLWQPWVREFLRTLGADPHGLMEQRGSAPHEWMTRSETANHLRVSVRTLDGWAASGEGPPYYLIRPKVARYRRDEVDAWAMRNRRLHTADDGNAAQILAEAEALSRKRSDI